MRTLFLTLGYSDNLHNSIKADYMCNLALHGFRSLFGADVVDFPKIPFMYPEFNGYSELWGKSFSYGNTLEDIPINRDSNYINKKVVDGYYDILYMSVHHSIHRNPYQLYQTLEWLQQIGSKAKIICADGNDERSAYNVLDRYPSLDITLFKRELLDHVDERIKPISFAIPKEKIVKEVPKKTRFLAPCIPADFGTKNRETHIYATESEYYQSYMDSWFGITVEKGGVCSMRGLEIMALGAIPIFGDLENCPQRTLCDMPKKEMLAVKDIRGLILKQRVFTKHDIQEDSVCFSDDIDLDELQRQAEFFLDYTRKNLTTEALANYVLREVGL